MKHPIPRFIFWLAVIACVVCAASCGTFGFGGEPTSGVTPAQAFWALFFATVTGLGLLELGAKILVALGFGVGAGATTLALQNRVPLAPPPNADGSPGVMVVYQVPNYVEWLAWIGAASILWLLYKLFWKRYRAQFLTAIGKLLTLRLPSALDAMHKASGAKHSREIRTGGE